MGPFPSSGEGTGGFLGASSTAPFDRYIKTKSRQPRMSNVLNFDVLALVLSHSIASQSIGSGRKTSRNKRKQLYKPIAGFGANLLQQWENSHFLFGSHQLKNEKFFSQSRILSVCYFLILRQL